MNDCPESTLLQKIADAILKNEKVTKALEDLKSPFEDEIDYPDAIVDFSEQAKPEVPVTIESEVEYPAAILLFRLITAQSVDEAATGFRPRLGIGEEEVKSTIRTTVKGSRVDFVHVHSRGGSYPALAKEINSLDVTDKKLAQNILDVFHGKDPSMVDDDNSALLADLTWLFFGTEAARNPSTLVATPMMLDLIANHGYKFDQFLNDKNYDNQGLGGGLFPMSFRGATPAARAFHDEYPGPDPTEKQLLELKLREKELVDTWLKEKGVPPPGAATIAKFAKDTYHL